MDELNPLFLLCLVALATFVMACGASETSDDGADDEASPSPPVGRVVFKVAGLQKTASGAT